MSPSTRARDLVVLHVILLLSGAAGLGYELAWTRMFAAGLGHELPSVLAIVTAFFGGLALGAFFLDGRVSRSPRPGRWYVGLELVIALWAFVTLGAIPAANDGLAALTGVAPGPVRHWLVAFGVPLVLLLPATVAMGATLPAMERVYARVSGDARSVSGLYGANTLGAMIGVSGTTFVLSPALGMRRTLVCLAVVNLAAVALFAARFVRGEAGRAPVGPPAVRPASGRLLAVAFLTGLLGIGYEVLGVRILGQVLEGTVYTFATVLSVYLLGTAFGAALYQRTRPGAAFDVLLGRLLGALALACAIGTAVMYVAPAVYAGVRGALGGSFGASIAAETAVAAAVFLIPTMLMGATFGHLAQAARGTDGGVGRTLGVNTAGGAVASLLFVVLLLPSIGAKLSLLVVSAGYLLCLPRGARVAGAPALLAAGALLLAAPPLRHVDVPAGGRVASFHDGVLAAVAVVEDAHGERDLKVNNRFGMGSTRTRFAERRQGHLPLLLHPAPRRALFLGLGTGDTFAAAADHPGLTAVAVELVPEVVNVLGAFHADTDPVRTSDDLAIRVFDAHRYVRATDDRFDVAVADLFHPARDGAGSLYTLEHFEAIAARLADGGLFCQWLPLYQLEGELLRTIIRTFLDVFPRAEAYLGLFNARQPMLALLGNEGGFAFDVNWYERRVNSSELGAALHEAGLSSALDLFGGYFGDARSLAAFAGEGSLNTADNQLVAFAAPRAVYTGARPAHDNLRAMTAAMTPRVTALFGPELRGTTAERDLDAYWRARDLYLESDMLADSGRDADALDALISSVEASPDFRLAYTVALAHVQRRLAGDRDAARRLLDRLRIARPERPEAAAWTERFFGE